MSPMSKVTGLFSWFENLTAVTYRFPDRQAAMGVVCTR